MRGGCNPAALCKAVCGRETERMGVALPLRPAGTCNRAEPSREGTANQQLVPADRKESTLPKAGTRQSTLASTSGSRSPAFFSPAAMPYACAVPVIKRM